MYDRVTLSQSDIAAYAGFWSWFRPEHEQKLNLIKQGFGYENLQAIEREIIARKRVETIEAFDTTPEIKTYMLDRVRERGSHEPKAVDYTAFLKGALENKRSPFGQTLPAYNPEPGASGIKLQPTKAVRVSYSQEAYSDDSAVAIPYTVDAGKPADLKVFQRNVSELVRRANSHNGMAGSGATYGAAVLDGFVVISCRSSIAD